MFEDELTEIEAEFFAEGRLLESPAESFADLDADTVRPGFWRRLFARPDSE
jgi:hypothetical protein